MRRFERQTCRRRRACRVPARRRRSAEASCWRGVLSFRGRGFSDVRKIRTHPLFPEQHGAIENVIARGAAALAPFRTRLRRRLAFSIEVGSSILGAELLAVAIN